LIKTKEATVIIPLIQYDVRSYQPEAAGSMTPDGSSGVMAEFFTARGIYGK
jgi:hypothetical protein